MIVSRTILPAIALLSALLTLTVSYNHAVANAPRDFFGANDDILLLLPADGQLASRGAVPQDLARILALREDVASVSAEIVVLTSVNGHAIFARGVDIESFLQLEKGATLREGTLPTALHEALVGESLAHRMRLAPGDDVLLPGSLEEVAVRCRITGILASDGLTADELIVSLPVARGLAGLADDGVHFIRVRASQPENLTRVVSATTPTFTYSNVRVGAQEVVAGGSVPVAVDVTNWGIIAGDHSVTVFGDDVPLAVSSVQVPPRATVTTTISVPLAEPGEVALRVNPTFFVEVRPPTIVLTGAPDAVALGSTLTLQALGVEGDPRAGVDIRAPGVETVTNETGYAALEATVLGPLEIEAISNGGVTGVVRTWVAPEEHISSAVPRVVGINMDDALVPAGEPLPLHVTLANVGGAAGTVGADVTVDGSRAGRVETLLAPGQTARLALELPALGPGYHEVAVEGLPSKTVEAFAGDVALERELRLREQARNAPLAPPSVESDAERYVGRLVRTVTLAAVSITVAAALLATLATFAVWSRHLAERASSIGVLKALGASRDRTISIVGREAALVATLGALGGAVIGIVTVLALSATGFVRGFGHRLTPTLDPLVVGVTLVFVVVTNVAIARGVGGRLYDGRVAGLISKEFSISTSDAPSLRELEQRAP